MSLFFQFSKFTPINKETFTLKIESQNIMSTIADKGKKREEGRQTIKTF